MKRNCLLEEKKKKQKEREKTKERVSKEQKPP